jgi:phage terminase large subunit GpA-like protein
MKATKDGVIYADAEEILSAVRLLWAPPPRLKVSEFADAHLVVTSGPLATARWRTSFMPYQAGILDAFFEPGIEICVLQASSQVGKTSSAAVLVAYHIAHDPCPILVVEPTVDPMAKEFSKNRLDPMIRASPILRDLVSKQREKDSSNTILRKTFRGGSLSIAGANSAASLAALTIMLLVLDEIDRYPAELRGEGATIQVALKRTAAYQGRRRILLLSSPTLRGAPIDSWFRRGDQRRYCVPCPSCGYVHPYRWKNVRWENDDPETARLHCPECDYPIDDAQRVAILGLAEWRAENPGRREKEIASFHLWEAYSPLSSLSSIVSGFLAAREAQKAGDNSLMHTWQNTTLGEAIELDDGDGVESHALLTRREEYPKGVDAPAGVAMLTMGVDVQDDRLEGLVVGWGPGEESWLVDRQTISGDTSQPEPWKQLDELLNKEYLHATHQRLSIQATCIDSGGHRTTLVYDYALKQSARRVYAIIGRDGQRPIVSSPSPKKWGLNRRKVPLYTVGVDGAKALLVSRFRLTERGPGYFHVPLTDWADEEMAAQLTSERLVTKHHMGVPKMVWQLTRPRNEALDCAVYALAALRLVHPNLELLAAQLENPDAGPPRQPPRGKRESWVGGKAQNWFKR